MIPEKLQDKATRFNVTSAPHGIPITIERRDRVEDVWVIMLGNEALSIDGKVKYEPMPSHREDDFLSQFRYTLDKAVELCNYYNLWEAEWRNGPGYVSNKFNMLEASK